jgi:predicted RNase H-like HicB family nuclease
MQGDLLEDLAVPYVAIMYSLEQDGEWVRRAEYPELPGCVAQSYSALEAMDQLELLRVRTIVEMRNRGEVPPRPRPPLKSGIATLGTVNLDELLEIVFRDSQEPKAK